MEEERLAKIKKWGPVITGLLSLLVLGFNLAMIKRLGAGYFENPETGTVRLSIDYPALCPIMIAIFLVLLLLHMVERLAIPREDRLLRMKHLLYILLCLGAVATLIIKGEDPGAWPLACFLYLVATLAGCVIEFIRKRNKWSLVVLILAVILFGLGGFLVFLPDIPAKTMQQLISTDAQSLDTLMVLINTFILIDTQAIMKIMPMAFSNIRMDILKRIIRKTYAVEILAGILILIIAFSLILPAFEPGIGGFGDALWYCFAIVTTIGFGDMYATSFIGRILSVILGLYGIIVVSLITSIIVNFYGEVKKEESEEEAKEKPKEESKE